MEPGGDLGPHAAAETTETFGGDVLVSADGPIGRVTLNRPQVRNALSGAMLSELLEAVRSLIEDRRIRVIVLTGAGSAFCAGDDLREAASASPREFAEVLERMQTLTGMLVAAPKPVVVAVNGPALGGGLELTLAADVRIAARSATFGCPEVGLGLVMTNGASLLLPRVVGAGRAAEMALTGRIYDADWALSAGLVGAVVPDGDLAAHATEVAELIAARDPLALELTRDLLRRPVAAPLPAALEAESTACMTAYGSGEARLRLGAFLARGKERR
ncbi:enoyl-CoA hydratase/isomerase family protein [Actinomadura sp. HBU206391]|uniref:enoyl-CoA hydratase/isomerase family protein n=1 Tax=Actinomadura sp. HBU206391 TaxID=2731692 RepID=UPI00164F90D2|nr:enoyl-CoA hydratase/isomerase family protein [Actinomadura sp. HBU206391]MBC6460826.1 enoyl-CoA hydratase/isomerase family protein [Actinomadura sp. HBU206391]